MAVSLWPSNDRVASPCKAATTPISALSSAFVRFDMKLNERVMSKAVISLMIIVLATGKRLLT